MVKPWGKALWIVSLLLMISAAILGCSLQPSTAAKDSASSGAASGDVKFANPDLIVETAWLAQHLDDPNIRIVDVRSTAKYKDGHIKNSVNLPGDDYKAPLYDQDNPVKWMVVTKEKIEPLLSDLGIGNDTTVVAVDEDNGLWAARLFWTLEYYGDTKVKVLNGGLKKWKEEKREVGKDVPSFAKAKFVAKPQPQRLATKDQVLQKIGNSGTAIIATVGEDEYTGKKVISKRGGHIPGAINIDWIKNLTSGDVPIVKTAAELSTLYQAAGITRDKEIIVY